MNRREREQLISAIKDFNAQDNTACFCSTSNNPPCSNCDHPGNVDFDELDQESQEVIKVNDKLQDTEFYPGDKILRMSDIDNIFARHNFHAYSKEMRKYVNEIDSVGVTKEGAEFIFIGSDERKYSTDAVVLLENAKEVITKRLLEHILDIQKLNFNV